MKTPLRLALLLSVTAPFGAAFAQAAAALPAAPEAARTAAAAKSPSPDLRVVEDDNVRIEETRVRGQLQRIVVHTRLGGAQSYEIVVGPPGRDLSQQRGAVGQRAWSLLTF